MNIKNRDYALDVLKIIGTILIVLHHYELSFDLHFDRINFGNGRFYFGYVVELFFIISGYFTFSSIKKIQDGLNFDRFFSAKVLRLLPVAAISTAVYSLMYLIAGRGNNFHLWKVLLTCVGMQVGGPFYEMFTNSHLWYVSVLLICYAMFFIAIRLSQRFRINWRYACFFMIVLGACACARAYDLPFINSNAGRGYMAFFTGIFLACALREHELKRWVVIGCLAVALLFSAVLIFFYDWADYGLNYLLTFMYYPAIIVVAESKFVQKILRWPFIGTMGAISFNVYVWHFEINAFSYGFDKKLELGIDFSSRWTELVFVLVTIAIGTASYYLLERPISRWIRKKQAERAAT